MKYSFIVPIYNVEKYLKRCVESLLAQTFKDFEVILIDDGSTDSSGDIADSYGEKYSDVFRVVHQENKGLGGARNTGIELAGGHYLLMVDSDDYVSPKLLECADKYLKDNEDDILIFNFITEEENGKQKVQYLHADRGYRHISAKEFIAETPAAWNKIYKAKLFKETDLRYPERIYYEDIAMTPCLALYADKIGVIDDALYYYIQRHSSIIHTKNTSRIMEIRDAVKCTIEYYKKNNKFDMFRPELEYLTVIHVLCLGVQRVLGSEYDAIKLKKLLDFVMDIFPDYKENIYVQSFIHSSASRKEIKIINAEFGKLHIEYILKSILKKAYYRLKSVRKGG